MDVELTEFHYQLEHDDVSVLCSLLLIVVPKKTKVDEGLKIVTWWWSSRNVSCWHQGIISLTDYVKFLHVLGAVMLGAPYFEDLAQIIMNSVDFQ